MLGWIFLPRLLLLFCWMFSYFITSAFETGIFPLLGFFFMPYTTLAYAFLANTCGTQFHLWQGFVLICFILIDIKIDSIAFYEKTKVECPICKEKENKIDILV